MILLHIVTGSSQIAEEISELLLKENLIISATIISQAICLNISGEKIIKTAENLILCKTRTSLFDVIDKRIQMIFPEEKPILYSIPLANMNWELAKKFNSSAYEI